MERPIARPGGMPPPEQAVFGDGTVPLRPLAEAASDRHLARHPEDLERYGPELARQWCVHDLQHVIGWAFGDVAGFVALDTQVAWLDRVLRARDYPMDNFYDALRAAADVVDEDVVGGTPVAARLRAVAA